MRPSWLETEILKLKKSGFFEGETLEEIGDRIIAESQDSYHGSILKLKDEPALIKIISLYEKNKVWFIEDFTILGSTKEYKRNFYIKVLQSLANISSGHFTATNITVEECGYCRGRDKRLNITFNINDKIFNLNFCIDSDVLVLSFLDQVNEIIASKGFSFQVVQEQYCQCFVYFLSNPQREILINDFSFHFGYHSIYWLDRAQFSRDTKDFEMADIYFKKALLKKIEPFTISEYADLLKDQQRNDEAIKVYQLDIQNLEGQNESSGHELFMNLFQEELDKLTGHRSSDN